MNKNDKESSCYCCDNRAEFMLRGKIRVCSRCVKVHSLYEPETKPRIYPHFDMKMPGDWNAGSL